MYETINFSFIMPAFKAKYLYQAIDSILNQSYRHFELIIVNDASPENLNDIVNQCKKNNIAIICILPPAYYELSEKQKHQCEFFREYCLENDIPLFDDFNNPFFMEHPELFFDNNHLNGEGAKIYTQQILEKIGPYVKSN